MSRLSKLMGEAKEVTIAGEIFNLKPLPIKHMNLIMQLENEKTRAEALMKIIKTTLVDSVPDATEQEVETIGLKYFQELTDAIMEVNGLKDDKTKAPENSGNPRHAANRAMH